MVSHNDIHDLVVKSFKNVFDGRFYDEFLLKDIGFDAFVQWEQAEHCYYSLTNPDILLPEQIIPASQIDLAYVKKVMAFAFEDQSKLSSELKNMNFSNEAIIDYVEACSHFIASIQNIRSNKSLN